MQLWSTLVSCKLVQQLCRALALNDNGPAGLTHKALSQHACQMKGDMPKQPPLASLMISIRITVHVMID